MNELLTLKDIARELGKSDNTLRYHKDKYLDFLPHTGQGRYTRFHPEALEVFKRIMELVEAGANNTKIESVLNSEFQRTIETKAETQHGNSTTSQRNDLAPVLGKKDFVLLRAIEESQRQSRKEFSEAIHHIASAIEGLTKVIESQQSKQLPETKKRQGFFARIFKKE